MKTPFSGFVPGEVFVTRRSALRGRGAHFVRKRPILRADERSWFGLAP